MGACQKADVVLKEGGAVRHGNCVLGYGGRCMLTLSHLDHGEGECH